MLCCEEYLPMPLFSQKKCSFNINVDTFLVSIKWLLQTFESFCKPVGSCRNPRQRLKAENEVIECSDSVWSY